MNIGLEKYKVPLLPAPSLSLPKLKILNPAGRHAALLELVGLARFELEQAQLFSPGAVEKGVVVGRPHKVIRLVLRRAQRAPEDIAAADRIQDEYLVG
jgi:hypothetical protein